MIFFYKIKYKNLTILKYQIFPIRMEGFKILIKNSVVTVVECQRVQSYREKFANIQQKCLCI